MSYAMDVQVLEGGISQDAGSNPFGIIQIETEKGFRYRTSRPDEAGLLALVAQVRGDAIKVIRLSSSAVSGFLSSDVASSVKSRLSLMGR